MVVGCGFLFPEFPYTILYFRGVAQNHFYYVNTKQNDMSRKINEKHSFSAINTLNYQLNVFIYYQEVQP